MLKKLRRIFGGSALRGSSVLVCLVGCVVVLQVIIITDMQCVPEVCQDFWTSSGWCKHHPHNPDRLVERSPHLDRSHVFVPVSRSYPAEEQDKEISFENKTWEIFSDQTCCCGLHFLVDRDSALVFPMNTTSKQRFLTIGIPTIRRRDDSYLLETIMSLVSNMDAAQQQEVLIVIMLADLDPEKRRAIGEELFKAFKKNITSGLIQVIQPPIEFYQPLKITKQTYWQGSEYIHWRSKQNFDYAYLMRFSANLSQYYMQLEDDVTAARNYVGSIRQYIAQQTQPWTCLEFSELGFIGKLYRSEDVVRLAQLLLMFYQEQPVDYTYLYFNMLTTQFQKRLRIPTVFQHRGIRSSFPGKVQPLKDRFFDQMEKKYKGDNPNATIYTTMASYLSFLPQLPYSKSEGFFWSHGSPGAGDVFVVVFDQPQSLDRVIVDTGSENHPTDILTSATLLASLTVLKNANRFECTNDIALGDFQNGRLEITGISEKVRFKVMCLQIKVTAPQKTWAIIREIAVFVRSF